MDTDDDDIFAVQDALPITTTWDVIDNEDQQQPTDKKKKKSSSEYRTSILDSDDDNDDSKNRKKKKKSSKKKENLLEKEAELDWNIMNMKKRRGSAGKSSVTNKRKRSSSGDAGDGDTNDDDNDQQTKKRKKRSSLSKEEYQQKRKQERLDEEKKKQVKARSEMEVITVDDDDIQIIDAAAAQKDVDFDPHDLVLVPGFSDVMASIRKTQNNLANSKEAEKQFEHTVELINKEDVIIPEPEPIIHLRPQVSVKPKQTSTPTTATTTHHTSPLIESTVEQPPADKGEKITLKLRTGADEEQAVKVHKTDPFSKIYNFLSKQKGVPVEKISLLFDNMKLSPKETVEEQDMEDGELIDVKIAK